MPINITNVTIEPILESVHCSIGDQALTLIIGRAGSGKSTFIQAIAGLMKLGSGSVTYDDIPLWNKKKLNRELLLQHAMAFQYPEHQLFAGTVQEEFNYSLRPYRVNRVETMRRTEAAMEELGLPLSMLDQSPFELSGGQKRSVALATLLATDSRWLFLDEPSSGLDARIAKRLREQLAVWKGTRGIVMATHDWEFFLPIADRVLVMADGRLLADLSPAELQASPGILQQAGIGVPYSMKVSCELEQAGISTSMQLRSPEHMAEAIIERWEGCVPPVIEGTSCDEREPTSRCQTSQVDKKDGGISYPSAHSSVYQSVVEEHITPKPRIYRIEARRKWLMYMTLSVLFLLQHQWLGLTVAMVTALSTLFLLRQEHALQTLRMCKPLLLFLIVAALFNGIGASLEEGFQIYFDVSEGLLTTRRMLPFLAVTLISFVFTLSTSTVEMQIGLEKALSIFERFRVPTKLLSLAASLVLRFIPMILVEAERFSRITAARGKRVVRRGQIHLRDIRVFTIPLLISLFQMVEDFIMAIEIKGFKDKHK